MARGFNRNRRGGKGGNRVMKALSWIIGGLIGIAVFNQVITGVLPLVNGTGTTNWFGTTTVNFFTSIVPVLGILTLALPVIWVIRKSI